LDLDCKLIKKAREIHKKEKYLEGEYELEYCPCAINCPDCGLRIEKDGTISVINNHTDQFESAPRFECTCGVIFCERTDKDDNPYLYRWPTI